MVLSTTATQYIKYIVIVLLALLLIGFVANYFKSRDDIARIRKQAALQVETAKKSYQQQISIYNSQIQQYQQEFQQSQQQLNYYKSVYNTLQSRKEHITPPKTSSDLRKRFEGLGYAPNN